ncbi:unnamed protein product [Urochloa decumbens]|uniref:F-box protein n=1 Tax=Urochloa decumbens TaxID=240449 RepID=A0ABC9FQM4_9POAL
MATRHASIAFRHLSRRLLGSSSAAASPRLLGYFHQPGATVCLNDYRSQTPSAPVFAPIAGSTSPRLSLDFLPIDAASSRFTLYDSHRGLLLLLRSAKARGPHLLVCDPVSRLHALLPPPPRSEARDFVGAALVSRRGGWGSLDCDAVLVTVPGGRPRAWVAHVRGSKCCWRALPPSREAIGFHPFWFECRCVHAAGSLYWHVCNNDSALALDAATMEFSFARAPSLILDEYTFAKFRFGETPDDGRLCVGALEWERLMLCVRGTGSKDGWVLERDVCLRKVLDSVPGLPKDAPGRTSRIWLGDIDAGRTGKVFISTLGHGCFAYLLDTGRLDCLTTDDGLEYGRTIFAYFSVPDGGSDS